MMQFNAISLGLIAIALFVAIVLAVLLARRAPVEVVAPEPETVEPEKPLVIAPAHGEADDLRRLKGVGPKLANLLNELGVTRFDQIACWSDAELAQVDARLGAFSGRATRDQWVEQAKLLAAGDIAGFEARFGNIDPQA